MNKDNLIFAVFGILVGFISGYLMHEVVVSRQPPRLTPELRAQIGVGEDPTAAGATDARAADAGMGAPGSGGDAAAPAGGPAMAEVQQLRDYVAKNPNDADAVLKLANLNFDIRNWQRAQELYTQYLKLRPADPDVLTDLGISYRESRNFDEALARFKEARKLAPEHWQSYYNEVVVLAFDLKRFDEADQLLAELQRIQPGNPEVAKLADAVTRQKSAA
ncbi:MAG TPA: tetratricopeptide repeat protein [Thermoanaerobaculia bacterium]|nr:tetratricopeptide repeat protein [Thermoanaerobaculia bacterium]